MASTKIAMAPTDKRVVNRRLEKFRNRDIGNKTRADMIIITIFRGHYLIWTSNALSSVTIRS